MPVKDHPVFVKAPSQDAKLWRYMSLSKYLSLLQTECLFLCNLELMAKQDPFEGTYPPSKFEHRKWKTIDDVTLDKLDQVKRYQPENETNQDIGLNRYKEYVELRIKQAYAYRKSYFVNCWHINEHESSAMWDIYSRKDEGIAIISTPNLINESLYDSTETIFCGVITYGDYTDNNFEIDENNGLNLIVNKRESFSHEKEFRIVFWDTSVTHKRKKIIYASIGGPDPHSGTTEVISDKAIEEIEIYEAKPGYLLKCNIHKLIKEIYVSPLAQEWILDVVRDITQKYSLHVPIVQSNLMIEPLR